MFIEALEFCLRQGYCMYDKVCYGQVEGVAMGSPLSPVVAELVLDKLFMSIKDMFDVKILVKYVDDNSDYVDAIFNYMNSFHERLEFTCEKENEKSINFLDMTLIRRDSGDIIFKHYKKPTHTGRIINFFRNNRSIIK